MNDDDEGNGFGIGLICAVALLGSLGVFLSLCFLLYDIIRG